MKKSIFFFAAIAAMFSCAKENPTIETPAQETFTVELTASAPTSDDVPAPASADTRTTLVDGPVVDGKPSKFVHWSQGDAIKVLFFPKTTEVNASFSGPSHVFKSNVTAAASAVADFSCNSWSWGDKFNELGVSKTLMENGVAVYPSSVVATSSKPQNQQVMCNTEISFLLPSSQNAVENNIESGLNFSYAKVNLSDFPTADGAKTTPHLRFKNACAIIELTMPSTLNKKVTSISLISNTNVPLTGKGTVRLDEYNNVIKSPFGVDVTEGNGVVLNNANGFEAGAKYYAVVWPGKHDGGLTIEFSAEDGTKATKTTPAVELTASKVKPYTFNNGLVFESSTYDYVYSDGTFGNEVKSNIVGVVIYNGNPKEKFNDPDLPGQYCNGLAIGLSSYLTTWGGSNVLSGSIPTDVIISSSSQTYDQGGYTVKKILNNAGFNNLPIYINSSYPNLPSGKTSGWYLGSKNEWNYIYENLQEINNLLSVEGLGAETVKFQTSAANGYWLPLNYEKNSTKNRAIVAYGNYYGVLQYSYRYNYTETAYARPIFAF